MFCIRCGTKNIEGAAYCHNCGAAMTVPPPSSSVDQDSPASLSTNNPVQPPAPTLPYGYPPSQPPYPNPYQQPPVMPGYGTPNNFVPGYGWGSSPAQPYPGYAHPLLTGAVGVPFPVLTQPQNYYSYVNEQGRVVLAKRVGFGMRLAAAMIDTFILFIPILIMVVILTADQLPRLTTLPRTVTTTAVLPAWTNIVSNLLFYAYFFFTLVAWGQSVGKRVMKIRVIRLDGRKPDWLTAFLRQLLGYTLSSVALGLGYLWVAWDIQKQGWHDKIARTLVIENQALEEGRDFYLPNRPRP